MSTEENQDLRGAFEQEAGRATPSQPAGQAPMNKWLGIGIGVAVVAVIGVVLVVNSGRDSSGSQDASSLGVACPEAESFTGCHSCHSKTEACLKCKEGYNFSAAPETPGVCGFVCIAHQHTCQTCKDDHTCSTCIDHHEVVDGMCKFKCADRQILAGCTKCADEEDCTECTGGYALSGGYCQYQCSTGQKIGHCSTCDTPMVCTTCEPGYVPHYNEIDGLVHKTCAYDCTGEHKDPACTECRDNVCTACKDTHKLEGGACVFQCTEEQKAAACTRCSDNETCLDCNSDHHLVYNQCELTCTDADTANGCRRCTLGQVGRCKACRVRWVWSPNYTCREVSGPAYQEFYTYRATNGFKYDPNGINTASAGGVMRYVHEEVVGLDCCAPGCKRKYEIDRIRRYLIKHNTSQGAYKKGHGQFGWFHQYDKAQCTYAGVSGCLKEYQNAGWYVGCQTQHVANFHYEDSIWLSFPGLCPSQPYWLKTGGCYLDEPGGNCSGCNGNNDACGKHPNGTIICGCNSNPMGGCVADNVTACVQKYFGNDDCTFLMEDAGEVFLDELVGIGPHGSYKEWCENGGIEHYVTNESKATISFWNGRKNVAANTARTYALLQAFEKKYPDTPYIGEPACEH